MESRGAPGVVVAAPGGEQSSAVREMFVGFPGNAVFGGASPLEEARGVVFRSALVHNVVDFVGVGRAACGVGDWEPADGSLFNLHLGIVGTVFHKERGGENVVAEYVRWRATR